MAKIHSYLNFNGNCEEAFKFYQKAFNATSSGFFRYSEMPANEAMPPLSEDDKNKVMHTSLKINDTTVLMGADVSEAFGQRVKEGNSTYLMLDVASREEAKQLFDGLSSNAKLMEMELGETFFAELFGSFQDQFGIYWMIHFEGNKKM